MVALVDTTVVVYRFDPRDRRKSDIATDLLRRGVGEASVRIAYQAIVEFYAAVTGSNRGFGPLLQPTEAVRETEELLAQFDFHGRRYGAVRAIDPFR